MITCKIKKITIPEYGDFYIRRASALLASQVSSLIANSEIPDTEKDLRAGSAVLSGVIVDEHGKRIYVDERCKELEDFDKALVNAILEEVAKFNRPLDELVKNSDPSLSAVSPSV
jgi:hypothetical protein